MATVAGSADSIKKDGVYITLGSNVLFTKSGFLKDTFGRNSVVMPSLGIYFSYKLAPFLEFSRLSLEEEISNRKVSYKAAFINAGLCNHVKLKRNLYLRQKYSFNILIPLAYNNAIDSKNTVGFVAGLGLQSNFNRRLSLYLDVNYQQQNKNMSGFLINSGIGLKLAK
jgi:hypothetical protein